MLSQSKIEVWYQVSGARTLLGKACSTKNLDVMSLWVDLRNDQGSSSNNGYRASLFDDGGRLIANKHVTQSDAECLLERRGCLDVCQVVNQLCYSVEKGFESSHVVHRNQADLAFN